MSDLAAAASPRPFSIVYGHAGLGKTQFLTQMPGTLALDMRREIRSAPEGTTPFTPTNLTHLERLRAASAKPEGERSFARLGIDGINELYQLVLDLAADGKIDWNGERANRNVQSWHKIAGPWLEQWLRDVNMGVPVMANAHRKIERESFRDYDVVRVVMNLPTGIRERLEKRADIILYVQMMPGGTKSQWVSRPAVTVREREIPSKGWEKVYRREEYHLTSPKDRYDALPERSELSASAFLSALDHVGA